MRRIWIAVLALLMASGLAEAGNGIGVYGSFWTPEDADSAIGGGVRLGFDMGPHFGFELRGGIVPKLEDSSMGLTYETRVVPLEAGLTLNIPLQGVTLYAGGGGGYYLFQDGKMSGLLDDLNLDVDLKDSVGFFGMGGARVHVSHSVALFAEANYLFLEVDEIDVEGETFSLDDPVDLSGFRFNAGLLLTW